MKFRDYIKNLNEQNPNITRDLKFLGCFAFDCELFEVLNIDLDKKQEKFFDKNYKKLKNNVPLAHLTKCAPFFGLNFYVDKNVLIPRMETEILVDTIIKENKDKKNLKILDLCTGSGCIAITLKKFLDCEIFASDLSTKALNIAKKNAKLHNVDINFVRSNMFNNIHSTFDIIVSNPPYIPLTTKEEIEKSVKDFEPSLALFGGNDGLKFYRTIAQDAKNFLKLNGKLYLEIGFDQGKSVPELLKNNFFDIEVLKDFDKNDRIVKCERR